jgi:hypothetical protein
VRAGGAAHPGTTFARQRLKLGAVASNHAFTPSKAEVTAAPFFCIGTFEMKTERFEGHHEATKALALSVAGVMVATLMWNLMMLLFY